MAAQARILSCSGERAEEMAETDRNPGVALYDDDVATLEIGKGLQIVRSSQINNALLCRASSLHSTLFVSGSLFAYGQRICT